MNSRFPSLGLDVFDAEKDYMIPNKPSVFGILSGIFASLAAPHVL